MKKSIFLFFIIACFYRPAFSQANNMDSLYKFVNDVKAQKTVNSKDILTNVFRASITNLFGKSKSLQFSSTFYAVDSLINKNSRSNEASFYKSQRALRGIQFNLSAKIDSNTNQLTNFSGGLTIALLNKRDIKYADFSKKVVPAINHFEELRKTINKNINPKNETAMRAVQNSWTKYDKSHDFADLDSSIREEVKKLSPKDQEFIEFDALHQTFDGQTKLYASKSLLTLSPDYSYDRVKKQSTLALSAAYLVGLSPSINKKPWELEVKSSISFMVDTTVAVANYKNRPFLISTGLNKVLREDADNTSTMELKGFFQYDYQFGDKLPGVDAGKVTFNTTWRINLYKSIWLPVTLRYDVKNANIFGFLSLTANIDK